MFKQPGRGNRKPLKSAAPEWVKAAPMLLTLIRFSVTCWLDVYTLNRFGALAFPVAASLLVFLTDFLDGWLARRLGCASRHGAIFDVAADFFYIASFGAVLCWCQVLPLWFMLALAADFLAFIITSIRLKRTASDNCIFIFDHMGRISAALFYILPVTAYVSYVLSNPVYRIVNPWFLLIVLLLAALSCVYRFKRCIKKKPG